ncbi:MAG TPA: response regulator [Verrucomicrobiae bacterium]|nr:response regulator [Verrucomicrobiae bacterium]
METLNEKLYGNIIVFADDSEDHYKMVSKALTACFNGGKQTTALKWVRNGEELVHYLLTTDHYKSPEMADHPAIIVLDIQMPKMNGLEVLEKIKVNPLLNYIPIICMSNYYSNLEINMCYKFGVNSFIKKPVNFDEILVLVKFIHDYWFKVNILPRSDRADVSQADELQAPKENKRAPAQIP